MIDTKIREVIKMIESNWSVIAIPKFKFLIMLKQFNMILTRAIKVSSTNSCFFLSNKNFCLPSKNEDSIHKGMLIHTKSKYEWAG